MKKLCSVLLLCCLLLTTAAGCQKGNEPEETTPPPSAPVEEELDLNDELRGRHTLRFGDDGEFRILFLSDVQSTGYKVPDFVKENINTLVARENPDLVIFTGDNTVGQDTVPRLRSFLEDMTEELEKRRIPWAHVYGNHDEDAALSKEEQQEVYESFFWCISKDVRPELSGVGNYVIPVYASENDAIAHVLYGLDSGSYLSDEEYEQKVENGVPYDGFLGASYDYIRDDQVKWYEDTSRAIEEREGHLVPSLMFFHIPLQENWTAWKALEDTDAYEGFKRDCITASSVHSSLFDSVLKRGDVSMIVNGHDHLNDYVLTHEGVTLCATATVGNECYYSDDMLGGRVVVLHENEPDRIDTYMSKLGDYIVPRGPVSALPSGTVIDFNAKDKNYGVTGWNCALDGAHRYEDIRYGYAADKGVDGSGALGICRTDFYDGIADDLVECKVELDTVGTMGNNRYVRFWMDLRGQVSKLDFGRAAFGMIANDEIGASYRTDNGGDEYTFYFYDESTGQWVEKHTGEDGCFGTYYDSSVEGLCGYFAFSLEDLRQMGTHRYLDENDVLTAFYFCFTYADKAMESNWVYIDDVALVTDYRSF